MFLTRASSSSTDPLKSWEYYDLYTDFMTLQMSFQKKSVSHSPFSWLQISVGEGSVLAVGCLNLHAVLRSMIDKVINRIEITKLVRLGIGVVRCHLCTGLDLTVVSEPWRKN